MGGGRLCWSTSRRERALTERFGWELELMAGEDAGWCIAKLPYTKIDKIGKYLSRSQRT
jgi:hypothetical protein